MLNSKLIGVIGIVSTYLAIWRKESELCQYHCRNSTKVGERQIKSRREKFLIFGNGITAIPSAHTCCPDGCSKCECAQGKPNDGKKKNWMELWQCHCRKWEEKKKIVAKIWEEILKKVLCSQYFYNTFITNHMWLVIISSNLILTLRLFF